MPVTTTYPCPACGCGGGGGGGTISTSCCPGRLMPATFHVSIRNNGPADTDFTVTYVPADQRWVAQVDIGTQTNNGVQFYCELPAGGPAWKFIVGPNVYSQQTYQCSPLLVVYTGVFLAFTGGTNNATVTVSESGGTLLGPTGADLSGPQTPDPPGFIRRAGNLAGAVVEHVMAGLPMVDDVAYTKRLAVCDDCPARAYREGACLICGCLMTIKARWAEQRCPLGHWPGDPHDA